MLYYVVGLHAAWDSRGYNFMKHFIENKITKHIIYCHYVRPTHKFWCERSEFTTESVVRERVL